MYIARILYPVEVLGPGKRIGIWFCGCPRRCRGCSNPELWEFQERYKVDIATVKFLIDKICLTNEVNGFTLTGGDPLFQYEEFTELVSYLYTINEDILVYTGYTLSQLKDKTLEKVAVLIDEPYIEDRNNGCILRGSDNQHIYIFNDSVKTKYEQYLTQKSNPIQNFVTADGYVSVGIHKKNFYLSS